MKFTVMLSLTQFLHSVIQKLKNEQTFLQNIQTEEAEEPLILTEREETKNRYFPPKISFKKSKQRKL